MKKKEKLFRSLGFIGDQALINSDSVGESIKQGSLLATSSGIGGNAAGLSVLGEIADGQKRGININKYTSEGAKNLAQGDTVASVMSSQISGALKKSAGEAMQPMSEMAGGLKTGGLSGGATVLAKKAGLGQTGQMISAMAAPMVFSEKQDNMIDSIMNKNFTVAEDLEDGAKSVGNAAGGIIGGVGGTIGGAAAGAAVGALGAGAWRNHQVQSALSEANTIQGQIKSGSLAPEKLTEANQRMSELSTMAPGKNGITNRVSQGVKNKVPEAPGDIKPGGAYQNLNKQQYNSVKAAAKSKTMGRGKGALIGMGVGSVLGGMQGQEKGSSLFSQVDDESRNYGVAQEAVNFAKTTGKYLWEKRKPIAKQAVIWGGAGMAGTYAADKLITRDAKKIGLMPSNNNQNQKQFAVINGSVLKNIGKKAWKYTGGLIKEHPGEAIMSAGFMGGMSAIPYLSQRGQYMANKRAIAQQQQKEFGAVGSVLRKGGNFAWNGLKWAGNAIKGFVYDPKRGKQISKDFQRIGKENNSQWAQKAGNWVENHKLAAGVGGAAATLASFEFMRPGEKITKSLLNKADKNAFQYEKQQNQAVQ